MSGRLQTCPTALHAAVRYESEGGERVVRLLLDAGADPNARYISATTGEDGSRTIVEGVTPLAAAAEEGNLEHVRLLLEAGARAGQAELEAALNGEKKHYHVANFLKRHIAAG